MRLLIADDDAATRTVLRSYAVSWGHHVIECDNGGDALTALDTPDPPALAILDWVMPGIDGPEVCRRLRAANSHIYVVLLTGRASSGDVVQALSAGADEHLSKMLSPAELRARLQAVIRTASLQEQVARQMRELRQAHENLRALVASSPLAIASFDRNGVVQMWNDAAVRMFGWSETEVLGLHNPTVPEDKQDESDSFREKALHGEHLTGVEVQRRTKAGRLLDVSLSTAPIYDTAGVPTGVMTIFQDVTEHRLLQAQLSQAQKLESIGQLAAGVAHEINTPMQYVGDNVEFLRNSWPALQDVLIHATRLGAAQRAREAERGEAAPCAGAVRAGELDRCMADLAAALARVDLPYLTTEIPTAIDQTLEGVNRVSVIIRAMKEFSHPGATERVPLDVNRAIETTINVTRHEWKYVCDIVTDLSPTLPPVPCLPSELNQVILNLVVNAAQAIADAGSRDDRRGRIVIQTRHTDDAVDINVADTGTGIPDAIRTRVFDPFFTTKEVGRGTGQGLAIAHDVVVHKHHGRIWFDTEVGTGTTFHVRLPLHGTGAPGTGHGTGAHHHGDHAADSVRR